MEYPTTSKSDLYRWMEEKNLQMNKYFEKAQKQNGKLNNKCRN